MDLLQKTALFEKLGENEIQSMLKCLDAYQREYKEGNAVFQEGQKIASVGIVLEGGGAGGARGRARQPDHDRRMGPGRAVRGSVCPAEVEEIPG